jgi:hypothetical protein
MYICAALIENVVVKPVYSSRAKHEVAHLHFGRHLVSDSVPRSTTCMSLLVTVQASNAQEVADAKDFSRPLELVRPAGAMPYAASAQRDSLELQLFRDFFKRQF